MVIISMVVSPGELTFEKVTETPLPRGTVTLLPVGVLSAGAFTVVVAVALLFPVLGSPSLLVTLAILVRVPVVVGVTIILTVALCPLRRRPMLQVTVPLAWEQLPRVELDET